MILQLSQHNCSYSKQTNHRLSHYYSFNELEIYLSFRNQFLNKILFCSFIKIQKIAVNKSMQEVSVELTSYTLIKSAITLQLNQ